MLQKVRIMEHWIFYSGLACILIHEMDAIQQKEWRIFPGLHLLDDRWGYQLFNLLHLPLYVFLFAGLFSPEGLALGMRRGLDLFFMIHVGLHLLFTFHPKNQFTGFFSWLWIGGAGLCGAVDYWGIG